MAKNDARVDDPVGKPTVYVVDPEPDVRRRVTQLLGAFDYTVKGYRTAEAFLSDFDARRASCLVMELQLPDSTGLELLQRLEQLGARLPIVILTRHGSVAQAVQAIHAGAVDFIKKPFVDRVLLERIRQALRTTDRKAGFAYRR